MSVKPLQAPQETNGLAWRAVQGHADRRVPPLCWPFPPGSQNQTDQAIRPKPYVPPKRRAAQQF